MRTKLVYVCGPFTAKTQWGVAQNVMRAREHGLRLANLGVMPVIPHAIGELFLGEGPSEHFWYAGTLALQEVCAAISLLPDWVHSRGGRGEVRHALALGQPILLTPSHREAWCSNHDDEQWRQNIPYIKKKLTEFP